MLQHENSILSRELSLLQQKLDYFSEVVVTDNQIVVNQQEIIQPHTVAKKNVCQKCGEEKHELSGDILGWCPSKMKKYYENLRKITGRKDKRK